MQKILKPIPAMSFWQRTSEQQRSYNISVFALDTIQGTTSKPTVEKIGAKIGAINKQCNLHLTLDEN